MKGDFEEWGLAFQAPTPMVADLIRRAHCFIWEQRSERFGAAASMLLRALNESPENHPVRIICLQKLAKIARCEYKYELAISRLAEALRIGITVLPLGHPRTLRVLQKMVRVYETESDWGPKGELVPAHMRRPLMPLAEGVYAEVIERAGRAQLPGLVALLRGDMFYSVVQLSKAGHHYREAQRLLAADDLNHERLRERLRDCSDLS